MYLQLLLTILRSETKWHLDIFHCFSKPTHHHKYQTDFGRVHFDALLFQSYAFPPPQFDSDKNVKIDSDKDGQIDGDKNGKIDSDKDGKLMVTKMEKLTMTTT